MTIRSNENPMVY